MCSATDDNVLIMYKYSRVRGEVCVSVYTRHVRLGVIRVSSIRITLYRWSGAFSYPRTKTSHIHFIPPYYEALVNWPDSLVVGLVFYTSCAHNAFFETL